MSQIAKIASSHIPWLYAGAVSIFVTKMDTAERNHMMTKTQKWRGNSRATPVLNWLFCSDLFGDNNAKH